MRKLIIHMLKIETTYTSDMHHVREPFVCQGSFGCL